MIAPMLPIWLAKPCTKRLLGLGLGLERRVLELLVDHRAATFAAASGSATCTMYQPTSPWPYWRALVEVVVAEEELGGVGPLLPRRRRCREVELPESFAALLAARSAPGSGSGRRSSSRSARPSCGRRSRPSRSASQACLLLVRERGTPGTSPDTPRARPANCAEEVLRILVDAAEPVGVGHRRRRPASTPDPLLVGDRQRLDDRRSCGGRPAGRRPATLDAGAKRAAGSPRGSRRARTRRRSTGSVKIVRTFLRLQVRARPGGRNFMRRSAAGSTSTPLSRWSDARARARRRAGRG